MGDITAGQQITLPADPSSAMHAATKQYVDTNLLATQTGTFPAGAVIPFAGSTVPNGWLLCAGQTVSRTTYANLFAIIGTTYGAGNGSTTFHLPDLRGRVVAGLDNMGGSDAGRLSWANTLGTTGGKEVATFADWTNGGSYKTIPEPYIMQPTMLLNWIISTGVGTTTRLWAEGRKTTTKTIPDVTSTTIDSFNAETDPYGMFNTSTGKFTLPVAGLWQFSVLWSFNADVANWNHHSINNETTGTAVASLRTASGPYINTLSAMQECAAGNVISFGIFADTASGATLNYCRFNAALIGT